MDSRSVGLPEGFEWAGPQTSPTTAPSGLPPGFEWDDQTTTDTAQDSEPGPQGYIANFLQAIKGVPEGMVSGVANEVLYPSVNRFKQGVESFKQGDPVLGGLQLAASVPGAEYVANLNGKASQAIHDLRSGNFGSAAVNAVEALPMGQTVKGAMDAFYQGAVEQFAKDPSINVATNPLGQLHGNLAGFALMEAAPKIAKSPAGKAVLETAGRVATNPIVGGVGTYLATGSSWKAVEVAGALSALKTKTGLGALKSYLPKYTHPILDKVFARGGEITAEEMAALAKAEAKTQKGRDQFAMDQLKLARDQVKAEDAIAAQKEAARLKLDKAAEAETIKAGTTEAKTIEAADKARAAVEKQAEAETITSAKSEVGLLEAGDRGQANLIKQSEAEAMSSGSIEAQILEMSQKAQAQAEAELFRARERASKAQGVEKGRAEHALALAKLKAERAVERTQSAQGRAEAAQIHREFRQRTQLDKAEARKKPPAPDQSLPEAPPEPPPTAPQLPQELPEWTPPPPEPLVAPEGPRRVGRWPRPYYSPREPGKMVELPPEPRPKDTPRLPKPETTAIAQYYQIDPAKSTHIEGMVGVHPTLGLPMNAEGKVLVRNAEEFNMNRAPGSSPKGNLVWRDPNRAYGANPSVMQMADIVNARVAPKAPIPSIAEQLSAQLRPDHVDRFKVPKDTPALADIRKESMARIEGDVVNAPPAFPGQQSAKGANNARFNRNQARLKGMRGESLSSDEITSLTDVDKRDIIKALEEKAALESPEAPKPPDVESTATQPKTASITTFRIGSEKGVAGTFYGNQIKEWPNQRLKVMTVELPTEGSGVVTLEAGRFSKDNWWSGVRGDGGGAPLAAQAWDGKIKLDPDLRGLIRTPAAENIDLVDSAVALQLKRNGAEVVHIVDPDGKGIVSVDLRQHSINELQAAVESAKNPSKPAPPPPAKPPDVESKIPEFTVAQKFKAEAESKGIQTPNVQYEVTKVPDAEYAKADANPDYVPMEETVGRITAPTEKHALQAVKDLQRRGELPAGNLDLMTPGTKPFIDVEWTFADSSTPTDLKPIAKPAPPAKPPAKALAKLKKTRKPKDPRNKK